MIFDKVFSLFESTFAQAADMAEDGDMFLKFNQDIMNGGLLEGKGFSPNSVQTSQIYRPRRMFAKVVVHMCTHDLIIADILHN